MQEFSYSQALEYYKEKYIWDHYVPLWNPEKVYDRFALQLEDWCETGTEPEACSENTAYGLDRQELNTYSGKYQNVIEELRLENN